MTSGSGTTYVKRYIVQTIIVSLKKKMNGLRVVNGRLVNERPAGLTGIQEASLNRKERKRQEKISLYSDAFALGEMKAEAREISMGISS